MNSAILFPFLSAFSLIVSALCRDSTGARSSHRFMQNIYTDTLSDELMNEVLWSKKLTRSASLLGQTLSMWLGRLFFQLHDLPSSLVIWVSKSRKRSVNSFMRMLYTWPNQVNCYWSRFFLPCFSICALKAVQSMTVNIQAVVDRIDSRPVRHRDTLNVICVVSFLFCMSELNYLGRVLTRSLFTASDVSR